MSLTRETNGAALLFGTVVESKVTPSTRKRTRRLPPRGSKWMSDAPRSTASAMIECTSFTTGASFADSRSSMTSVPSSSGSSSSTSWTDSPSWVSWAISASMSSGELTAGRTARPVASRMSSNPITFSGSAHATSRVLSSWKAIGIARKRRASEALIRLAAPWSATKTFKST